MIIVFVIENYNSLSDGTIISARRFTDGLRERGHTVRIVSLDLEGKDMFSLKRKYIPIISWLAKRQGQAFMKFDKKIMKQALDGADIVHCFLPWKLAHQTHALATKMGIACTSAFHCHPDNVIYNIGMSKLGFVSDFTFFKFRLFYNKLDNIHCPSKFIADNLKERGYRSKMHVFSNGIMSNFVTKIRTPEEALVPIENRDVFNLLMVGRLANEKCQDTLIKAVSLSKYKDKIQIYYAGKGPLQKKLEKMGKKLPRPPIIKFLSQKDLINWLYSCDLYIHTAEVEIEGISCIEAFTCGKVPVLAESKKSAASQFAITEHSLFPVKDHKALAQKIDFWIEHPELRYEYEKKYAEVSGSYKLEYSLDKFEAMLNDAKQDIATKQMLKDKDCIDLAKRAGRGLTLTKIIGLPVYYFLVVPGVFIINKLFFGLKIKNKKHLLDAKRKSGSAIVICNHVHEMDPTMCGLAIFPFKPIFTSKAENFKSKYGFFVSFMVNLLGTVPVPGNQKESRVFFYLMEKQLRCGRVVHFYPEGHLVRWDENLRKFHSGAFQLSVKTNVPIVPIRIVFRKPGGIYKLLGRKKPFMTMIFGEPLYHNEENKNKEAINSLKERAKESMEKIARDRTKSLIKTIGAASQYALNLS